MGNCSGCVGVLWIRNNLHSWAKVKILLVRKLRRKFYYFIAKFQVSGFSFQSLNQNFKVMWLSMNSRSACMVFDHNHCNCIGHCSFCFRLFFKNINPNFKSFLLIGLLVSHSKMDSFFWRSRTKGKTKHSSSLFWETIFVTALYLENYKEISNVWKIFLLSPLSNKGA